MKNVKRCHRYLFDIDGATFTPVVPDDSNGRQQVDSVVTRDRTEEL